MQTAFSDMAVVLGDTLAPVVTDIVNGISKMVKAVSEFSMSPLEKMINRLEEMGADVDLVKSLKVDLAHQKVENLNKEIKALGGDNVTEEKAKIFLGNLEKENIEIANNDGFYEIKDLELEDCDRIGRSNKRKK